VLKNRQRELVQRTIIYPPNLFAEEAPTESESAAWTCLRTKPRSEKRFAEWLAGRRTPHFLPTLMRMTKSHRRVRHTPAPLFPSYLFVAGEASKGDFKGAPWLVDVVPSTSAQRRLLHGELWRLHRALESGSPLELVSELEPGEMVEVVAGAMKGVLGRFQRWGKQGRLVLWVEMLGAGASVEIDEACVSRL
jgi:transcriptional antiterminator RfaH